VHFTYSRAIPLLPLWAVRPVQSLSACTRVTFTFENLRMTSLSMGSKLDVVLRGRKLTVIKLLDERNTQERAGALSASNVTLL